METIQSQSHIQNETPDPQTIIQILNESIQIIDEQSKIINTVVEKLTNVNDQKGHLMKILNTLDIIKAHFELTSKILQTNSADEVVSVKASLKLKGKEYEQVIAKEDLNLMIIKEALDYLNQGPLTKLQDVVKRCSLEEEKKTPKIIEIDSAWIQILNQRIKVFTQFYPNMATADKQDLFSQPKTSEAWQELQKNITYRTLGTKQELAKGTENIRTILLGLFSVIREKTQGVESPQLPSTISMVKEAFARKKDFEMTEAMAGLFLINPNEHIKKAWSVADDPLVSTLVGFTLPHIGYDKCIHVPKIFPAITKELIQQEYQNLSINKLGIDNKITLPELKTEDERAEIIRDLFTPNPSQKVMVRILSSEPLLIENNVGEKIGNFFHQARYLFSQTKAAKSKLDSKAIVIHVHGGGYCAGSSAAHRAYLIPFANKTKFVHFSIDYSLAPEHQYPEGFNDVWQAYLWILSFAESVLGIKHQKVIVMGDSAGGNLVLALTLRLIKSGLPAPDACFLIYPSVKMGSGLTSPSLIRSLEDPVISYEVRGVNRKLYVPEDTRPDEDPFMSPILASDELLEKIPPVRLIVGTADPLHDDNLRFIQKLLKLKKDAKALVYENYIHGFVAMKDVHAYDKVLEDCCNIIEELANL